MKGLQEGNRLSGRIQVSFLDRDSGLLRKISNFLINQEELEKNELESSAASSQRHSHFPKSKGIPHSASTIIGSGVSFANAFRNSGLAYRIGLVGIFSSFGGHGGAGSGFEYRTRTRRSSFELGNDDLTAMNFHNCMKYTPFFGGHGKCEQGPGNHAWDCECLFLTSRLTTTSNSIHHCSVLLSLQSSLLSVDCNNIFFDGRLPWHAYNNGGDYPHHRSPFLNYYRGTRQTRFEQ